MRVTIGHNVNGSYNVSNPTQRALDLAAWFDPLIGAQTYTDLAISIGHIAAAFERIDGTDTVTALADGPLKLTARGNIGAHVAIEVFEDSETHELYRIAGGAGIGCGRTASCSGCGHCVTTYDSSGNAVDCTCALEGSCDMGTSTAS